MHSNTKKQIDPVLNELFFAWLSAHEKRKKYGKEEERAWKEMSEYLEKNKNESIS